MYCIYVFAPRIAISLEEVEMIMGINTKECRMKKSTSSSYKKNDTKE